jgi:hypothetical protein
MRKPPLVRSSVRHIVRSLLVGMALVLCTGTLRAEERGEKAFQTDAPAPIAADRLVFQARLDGFGRDAEGSPVAEQAPSAIQLQIFDQALGGEPLAEPTLVEFDAEAGDQIRAELPLDGQVATGAALDAEAEAAASGDRWLEASLLGADGELIPLSPRHALGAASRMANMEGAGFTLSGMTWRATTDASSTDATTEATNEPASYGELLNLSTRGYVGTGDAVMIAGFIVDAPTVVMVRALGPSLAASGVPGALQDPTLTIYSGGTPVAYNDDWVDSELSGAIANTFSLAPADPSESVVIHVLDRGAYTAIVEGYEGETGIGLVEVFQLGRAAAPQAQVTVNNQTGAALCYEVHGSGIGERCFGQGVYTYGLFEAGTYAFTVRGACGSSSEIQDYPEGHWSHSFWCEPASDPNAGGSLIQQLESTNPEAAPVR